MDVRVETANPLSIMVTIASIVLVKVFYVIIPFSYHNVRNYLVEKDGAVKYSLLFSLNVPFSFLALFTHHS